jgi:hypothetical protein
MAVQATMFRIERSQPNAKISCRLTFCQLFKVIGTELGTPRGLSYSHFHVTGLRWEGNAIVVAELVC